MQLTTTLLASAMLVGSSLAAPAAHSKRTSTLFQSIALRSGSAFHQLPLTIKDLTVIVSSDPPTTYCPSTVSPCPPGNETVFGFDDGEVFMDTEVAGGQSVYVAPNGQLMVLEAHSSNYPLGSYKDGFTYTPGQETGQVGTFGFTGGSATGFLACGPQDGEFLVFADVAGAQLPDNCLGMDAGTIPYTGQSPAAWQYD